MSDIPIAATKMAGTVGDEMSERFHDELSAVAAVRGSANVTSSNIARSHRFSTIPAESSTPRSSVPIDERDEVELAGLEPATSWVRSRRSPN